jgi:IQ domain-containing protein D
MNKLRYLKSSKTQTTLHFEQLLQEVKVLVYERLKTTVEEEKSKQDQLSIIIAKEQKVSNVFLSPN